MNDDAGFRVLFETALEIDEDRVAEARRGGEVVVGDQDLSLLQHQNRVALAIGKVVQVGHIDGDPDISCYDITLQCVLHPAAGCRFREAKLVVDLGETPGALVRDMTPRDVRGDHPIEVTSTVSAGLTFDIIPAAAGVELKRERSVNRKVYQPEILASGRGFTRAVWTFRSVSGEFLSSERDVRLLASAPAGAPLLARFNLRAQVTLDGAAVIIPMLRRRAEIGTTYQLT